MVGYMLQVSDKVKELMTKTITQEDHTKAWNEVQTEFKCCGINNYTDWHGNPKYSNNTDLPNSCCANPPCNDGNHFGPGCYKAFVDYLEDHVYYVGAVGIAFAVIQVSLKCSTCIAVMEDIKYLAKLNCSVMLQLQDCR